MQVRYRRLDKEPASSSCAESSAAPKPYIETVTVFVPDVWNLAPASSDFTNLHSLLKGQLESKLAELADPPPSVEEEKPLAAAEEAIAAPPSDEPMPKTEVLVWLMIDTQRVGLVFSF